MKFLIPVLLIFSHSLIAQEVNFDALQDSYLLHDRMGRESSGTINDKRLINSMNGKVDVARTYVRSLSATISPEAAIRVYGLLDRTMGMASPLEIRNAMQAPDFNTAGLDKNIKGERETVGKSMTKYLQAFGNSQVEMMASRKEDIHRITSRMSDRANSSAQTARDLDIKLRGIYSEATDKMNKGAHGLASSELEKVGSLVEQRQAAARSFEGRTIGFQVTESKPPQPPIELMQRFPSLFRVFTDVPRANLRPMGVATPGSAAGLEFGGGIGGVGLK